MAAAHVYHVTCWFLQTMGWRADGFAISLVCVRNFKMSQSKRVRKANFSESEVLILLNEISHKHCILFGNETVSQQRKNEIWNGITQKVNLCGVAQRKPNECRDKWRAMRGAVSNKLRANKKTVGGQPPPPAPYEDLILKIIGNKANVINEINVKSENPTCGSQLDFDSQVVFDAQQGYSQWSGESNGSRLYPNSCHQLPVATLPRLPDDTAVVCTEVNHHNGSVDTLLDADLSTSQQPVSGHSQWASPSCEEKLSTGEKRKKSCLEKLSWSEKEKWLGDLSLIQVLKNHHDLVEEWLLSEISKNNALEALSKKKERKIDLEIRKLELELGILGESSVSTQPEK